ncbi:MAG: tetratricopeptide repeat protein [Nitrospinae bacterium]|nr:tetratricopeptide repeat protein [Nitrospinota bacterium]
MALLAMFDCISKTSSPGFLTGLKGMMCHPKRKISVVFDLFIYNGKRKSPMVAVTLLLIFSISFNPAPLFAQVHPGYENFKLSAKDEAELLFARGRYKESIEKFKEILKSEKETSYIFRMMLKAWQAMQDLGSAEQFLKNYPRPDSTHFWYATGYLNYLKGEYTHAEKAFIQAIEREAENGLAWNNWGAILSEKKQYELAVDKVKKAIDVNPKEPMFVWNLNKIYKEMGEPDRFKNEYKNLLQQNSQLAWAYGKILVRVIRQRAFGSYSKGELDQAIAGFEEMLKIYQEIGDTKGQVPAYFSLGLLHEEKGNGQKAREYFKRVLAINPNHIQARDKIKTLD